MRLSFYNIWILLYNSDNSYYQLVLIVMKWECPETINAVRMAEMHEFSSIHQIASQIFSNDKCHGVDIMMLKIFSAILVS